MSRFGINICRIIDLVIYKTLIIDHFSFWRKMINLLLLDKYYLLQEINKLREVREINLGGGFMKLFMENRLKEFFSTCEIYKSTILIDCDSIIEPGSNTTSAYMITSPANSEVEWAAGYHVRHQYTPIHYGLFHYYNVKSK